MRLLLGFCSFLREYFRLVFAYDDLIAFWGSRSSKFMPDSKTHKYVGITAGLGFAGYQAKEQKGLDFWIELFGGAVGGWPGSKLPDIFEPAISSWHRSTFHSLTAGGAIVSQASRLSAFTTFCREQAGECKSNPRRILMLPLGEGRHIPIELGEGLGNLLSKLEELLWRFLAGFVNGLAAGYVSHLALDAFIGERGIPLLTRGL
jgi:hypothetical protein